jgi:comEA protein
MMFSLTPKERKALIFIGALILIGSLLKFLNIEAKEHLAFEEKIHSSSVININEASKEKLEELPGVGAVTASRIIDYRNEFGHFKSLEDLTKVKGIGPKKAAAIKQYISF